VRLPWLAHDEAPGPYITIPQYQFNKKKQHTHTQLALQVHQEWLQVVCSDKEARKRLTESNGTPAIDLGHLNVILK